MRILIVEDDIHVLAELETEVLSKFDRNEILVAKSRNSAISYLKEFCFDAVILDRNIPSYDEAMDANVAYGEVVYAFIMENIPGTLVRFWTAYFVDDYISEKVDTDVRQEDVWGNHEFVATVGIIPKARFNVLNDFLFKVKNEKAILNNVEIRSPPSQKLQLTNEHKKLLKIFARRQGGNAIEVSNLTKGLSSSSVVRASVYSGSTKIIPAAGKLSSISQVKDEVFRQRRVNNLAPGSFTVVLDQVRAGAGNCGATFYRLADDYDHSLFDLMKNSPELAGQVVDSLKIVSKPWVDAAYDKKQTIKALRQKFLSDEIFEQVAAKIPEIREFEKMEVDTLISVQHSDMHGENVLLDKQLRPILIDYGDVEENHSAIDPITLELSAIFHPDGFCKSKGWPTLDDAKNWCDLSQYLKDSPIADYIEKCRNWAYEAAPGNRSYYAMAMFI